MARTQLGDPKNEERASERNRIIRAIERVESMPSFDEERAKYRKMEDDYMTEMTVKHPSQYRGHDYDKAIEKMNNR